MLDIAASLFLFFVLLSVLVVVHELGHFFFAKLFGVRVEEFGIGFPPRIRGFLRKGTVYSFNWLPLGGFVKLKGEQGDDRNDPDSFASKPLWQRLIILAGGVGMNFFLAMALITVGYFFGTPRVLDDQRDDGFVQSRVVQVTQVLSQAPAHQAGIMVGDIIGAVNGARIASVSDVQQIVRSHEGVSLAFTVMRGQQSIELPIIPQRLRGSGIIGIGIGLENIGIIRYPPLQALWEGARATFAMTGAIVLLLIQSLQGLAFHNLVGPVGIAVATSTVTKLGVSYILTLVAQLSLSLAVMNFLPLPALDGGRAFLAVVEKIRRKKFDPQFENAVHGVGFLILLFLLILITVKDVSQLLLPS